MGSTPGISVSATSLSKFQSCPRDWWFDAVARYPRGTRPYGMIFGEVLHAVVERYLKADESGRGPDGQPVECFPWGWQYAEQDRERIEEADEEVIRALLEQATEKGFLVRLPGRQIERKFMGLMVTAPEAIGAHVVITGKVDQFVPPGSVIDHKGVKSMRYALSAAQLADDTQLLCYAKVLADEHPEQQEFELCHIAYDRTAVRVRKTVATVSRADVYARWEKLTKLAVDMQALAAREDYTWDQVPGAIDGYGAGPERCAAYGGCRFLDVCRRIETPEHFRRRYLRLAIPSIGPLPQEKPTMGLMDKLRAVQAGLPPTPTPPPVEEIIEDEDDPRCAECDGSGKTPLNTYCRCPLGCRRSVEDKAGVSEPILAVDLDGAVDQRENGVALRRQKKPCFACAQPIEKGQAYTGTKDKSHLICPMDSQIAPESAERLAEVIEARVDNKDFGVLPATTRVLGPVILHGCAMIKGDVLTQTVSDVLLIAVEEIGASSMAEFYAADVWKRRDGLLKLGKQIATRLGDTYVIARGQLTQDELAVVAAISPYSSMEIGAAS